MVPNTPGVANTTISTVTRVLTTVSSLNENAQYTQCTVSSNVVLMCTHIMFYELQQSEKILVILTDANHVIKLKLQDRCSVLDIGESSLSCGLHHLMKVEQQKERRVCMHA